MDRKKDKVTFYIGNFANISSIVKIDDKVIENLLNNLNDDENEILKK